MLTSPEGDRVLLRIKDETKAPVFTKPLRSNRRTDTRWGAIEHKDIIGKRSRDVVLSSSGHQLRLHIPTLEDYVLLTPRIVTPVYPADANLIISLLDIHVSVPGLPEDDGSCLEILEAGTGHGALTLFLARAIHAANPAKPWALLPDVVLPATANTESTVSVDSDAISYKNDTQITHSEGTKEAAMSRGASYNDQADASDLASLEERKSRRRAIIHTLDISHSHSQHAKTVVRGFRQGIYADSIDFHVGDISKWIKEELISRGDVPGASFLSHIILDLPGSHTHLEAATSALHVDGSLLVFNPSISQIMRCVQEIRRKKLPLALDRVLELGPSLSGGKEWDVRAVRPRAVIRAEQQNAQADPQIAADTDEAYGKMSRSEPIGDIHTGQQSKGPVTDEEEGWEMICRPKVGTRLIGGGFIGLWKKMQRSD